MHDLHRNPSHVLALVRRINACRFTAPGDTLEALIEQHFRPSRRLAVYGTLAPGEANEDQLIGLSGTWSPAILRGERSVNGWGLTGGYPGYRWDESGVAVPALLFESDDLPAHWTRLDSFEGPAYRRILVPVYRDDQLVGLANTYEAEKGENARNA